MNPWKIFWKKPWRKFLMDSLEKFPEKFLHNKWKPLGMNFWRNPWKVFFLISEKSPEVITGSHPFQIKIQESLANFLNEELTFCEFYGSGIRYQVLCVIVGCFNHHTRSGLHFDIKFRLFIVNNLLIEFRKAF